MFDTAPASADARRPLILLTNDDGIHAPGLYALAHALGDVATLRIIAPEHNWSAAGHSKTMHKPLRVYPTKATPSAESHVCSGSPSDCVTLALLGVLGKKPDLVISGINQGANVGHDLTYSGTVAGAMEAVIGGVSAIAISLDDYSGGNYGPGARFARHLVDQVLAHPKKEPLLLNVNVPALPEHEIQGVQVTRLGHRLYRDALVKRTDPRGRPYYWIGGEVPSGIPEKGTDIGALAEGFISVTPVLLDLTAHDQLAMLREWDLAYDASVPS